MDKNMCLKSTMARLGAMLTISLSLCATSPANATFMLELQRVDDSTVILTGSGTADSSASALGFLEAASTGDTGFDSFTGNLAIGGVSINNLFISAFTNHLAINFFNNFNAGDAITGSATITLDVETWAAVGTTGLVTGQGSYVITSTSTIPEPGTLAILGLGLLGIGFARRKRLI